MRADTIFLLVNPITRERLSLASLPSGQETLFDKKTGQVFSIRNGIPYLLVETSGLDRKAQSSYNFFAPLYDSALWIWERIEGNARHWRRSFLSELEVKEGASILEVSIGSGANLPYLPRHAKYFGLDISLGMLKKCQKNLKKWGREAELFLGTAEDLPFIDEAFDAVFHIGGINFFSDKGRAINEMIRVAKPGTKILIGDETEKVFRWIKWVPFFGHNYERFRKMALPPIGLVPADMLDVKVDYLINGLLYRLSFRKP